MIRERRVAPALDQSRLEQARPTPMEVKEQEVDARFIDGVLKITLPKTEKVAPKQIEIKR